LSIVIVTSQLQKPTEQKKEKLAISWYKHMLGISHLRAGVPKLGYMYP